MPDITMCRGDGCPLRGACWRYKAKPDKYAQSFFVESPYKKGFGCEHFYPMPKLGRRSHRLPDNEFEKQFTGDMRDEHTPTKK